MLTFIVSDGMFGAPIDDPTNDQGQELLLRTASPASLYQFDISDEELSSRYESELEPDDFGITVEALLAAQRDFAADEILILLSVDEIPVSATKFYPATDE